MGVAPGDDRVPEDSQLLYFRAVRPDDQPTLVRALAFGLVPDELRPRTAGRLADLIRGHELLLRDTSPSWPTMIDRGATTVWVSWEGIDSAGHPHESLNQCSKGAVIGFLHRYMAGIRLTGQAAYRSFVVEPVPWYDRDVMAGETETLADPGSTGSKMTLML